MNTFFAYFNQFKLKGIDKSHEGFKWTNGQTEKWRIPHEHNENSAKRNITNNCSKFRCGNEPGSITDMLLSNRYLSKGKIQASYHTMMTQLNLLNWWVMARNGYGEFMIKFIGLYYWRCKETKSDKPIWLVKFSAVSIIFLQLVLSFSSLSPICVRQYSTTFHEMSR